MESIEDKQNYLRSEIIDKGFDPDDFFQFLSSSKSGDVDLQDWNMNELVDLVNGYKINIENNQKLNLENNGQKEENINEIKQEKKESEINENLEIKDNLEKNEKDINLNNNNKDYNNDNNNNNNNNNDNKDNNDNDKNINNKDNNINNTIENDMKDFTIIDKNTAEFKSTISSSIDLSTDPLEQYSLNLYCQKFPPSDIENIEDIKIIVSDPILIKGGFFSKSYYKYTITTPSLGYKIERKLDDFDWLYNKLNELYPGVILSPIPSKGFNLKDDSKIKITLIEFFLNSLSHYKSIRSTKIFQDFISLPLNDFEKNKKDEYEKIQSPDSFSTFTNLKGEINILINQERDNICLKYKEDISKKNNAYIKLNNAFDNIISAFDNCKKYMNELSQCFNELKDLYIEQKDFSEKFQILANTTINWSKGYENQSEFFLYNLKYFFKYFNKELNEALILYNSYKTSKDVYISEFLNLKKKLGPSNEDLRLLNNLRKHYGYYLSSFLNEYQNLNKRHEERMSYQLIKYSENTNIYIQDYQKFISLLSIYY